MLDVSIKESRGMLVEKMRKAKRDSITIQLYPTTSDKLAFDIHSEMSVSHSLNKDNLSQCIHVWLSPGHAPNKKKMNFLQPCQH